ncbi:phospho-acceptor domain-containing protein [Glaciihabitans tibetensis]|uniref:histidine kinase n=1 Tax=Glaciihabitans tibetensis TaxID=1266600 RepID=A0A2T0V4L4_9MICO|nr:ATP-binding protein [Glaciihabitans tibetensis]PRY64998.1 phospho-acceptor domain-containing protein [Glaciihabitans tibetensis]
MGSIARVRADGRDRRLFVLLAQVPLLVVLGALIAILRLFEPAVLAEPAFIASVVLAVLTSAAALFTGERRPRFSWIALVPFSDILVIALAREGLHLTHGTIPALGALVIFPVLWLATELRVWSLPAVLVASGLLTGLPYVLRGTPPQDPIEWLNVVLVPTALGSVALAAGSVMRRMREDRSRADDLAVRLGDSLAEASDRELTLRSVTETVEAAIVLFGPAGDIVLCNSTARLLYGRAGADEKGHFSDPPLIFGEDRVTRIPLDGSLAASALRDDPMAGRTYWIGATGAQRAVTVTSRRVTRPDGGSLGTVVVGYDVTPLVESIEIRDVFLASVSHELKTPLTNIIGYLDLMEEGPAAAEIAVVRNNAARLMGLISDLLTGAGTTQDVHRVPEDLTAITEAAIAAVLLGAQSSGVGIRLSPGAKVVAEVDRDAIRRVLDNLLSNAVKYSAAGTHVVVAVGENGRSAVITVEDSGVGISPEHQGRVFDRFFRAPLARSQAIPGTGLGLAIVQALVEAHGGTVSVESQLGTGSVFTVLLPLRTLAVAV